MKFVKAAAYIAAGVTGLANMASAIDPYFVQETGTCAGNGGAVIQTNGECQTAVVVLGLTTTSAFSTCTDSSCGVFFTGLSPWNTGTWEYDTYPVSYRPSGCGMWESNRHIRWSGVHANEVCGSDSFYCICKATATGGPTTSPTKDPTNSPTTTPWDIELKEVDANFTAASEKELKILYSMGNGRDFFHELKAGGCEDPLDITGLTKGVDYNVTNSTTAGVGGLDSLELVYSFDKAKIAQSNIWDEASKAIVLCQILQLTLEGESIGNMVISEVKSNITIDFDLIADFNLTGATAVDLDGATILANRTNTTLDEYISAYMCEDVGVESEGENLKLVPNKELKVCIESSSSDVQIESIDFMKIDGTNPDTKADQELIVMEGKKPKFDDITSFTILNEDPKPTGMVITRIPPSLFDYEAIDAKIEVSGYITLKLAGTQQRKLMLGNSERVLQAGEAENDAAFDVVIDLQPGENVDKFEEAMMSSANAIFGKVLSFVGMAAVSVIALW